MKMTAVKRKQLEKENTKEKDNDNRENNKK